MSYSRGQPQKNRSYWAIMCFTANGKQQWDGDREEYIIDWKLWAAVVKWGTVCNSFFFIKWWKLWWKEDTVIKISLDFLIMILTQQTIIRWRNLDEKQAKMQGTFTVISKPRMNTKATEPKHRPFSMCFQVANEKLPLCSWENDLTKIFTLPAVALLLK